MSNWFKRAEGDEEPREEFPDLSRWKAPNNYSGVGWEGYYAAPVGRSRDSDTVEQSNWEVQLEMIPPSDTVKVVTEGHWAVGWVEWLAIHESDRESLAEAQSLAEVLQDYPILDDDHHSELEWRVNTEAGLVQDESGEWVEWIEDEWQGTIEGIEIPDLKGAIASATVYIEYKYSRKELRINSIDPISVEVQKPNGGRVVAASNGQVIVPGLVHLVIDELMHQGEENAELQPVFKKMVEEVHEKHGH